MNPPADVALLVVATALLFAGHVVRAVRHAFLFPLKDVPTRHALLLALSIGYALNAVLPLRIGELCRAVFLAVRLRVRLPYVLATVVIERLTDLAIVAVILALIGAYAPSMIPLSLSTGIATLSLIVMLVLVRMSRSVRMAVWSIASVLNDRLRRSIIETVWTTTRLAGDRVFLQPRYLVATAAMWCCYFASFRTFSAALHLDPLQVIAPLLGSPLRPLLAQLQAAIPEGAARLIIVCINVPVLLVLAVGFIRQRKDIERAFGFVRRFGLERHGIQRLPVARRFQNERDLESFLAAQFGSPEHFNPELITAGLEDAIVVRLFAGGSDALTGVVDAGGTLTIRKAARDAAAERLKTQYDWMRRHQRELPMANAGGFFSSGDTTLYEMPFYLSARDFYDHIHTVPVVRSAEILRSVIESVQSFHCRQGAAVATNERVAAYLESKASSNARLILQWMRTAVAQEYRINGETYSLEEWNVFTNNEWLHRQVRSLATCSIHGDLTVENIIVHPDSPSGWYLIDPNPENTFDTPLIDWAKLRQSLNLGYEQLNRLPSGATDIDDLRVPMVRSKAYADLFAQFEIHLSNQLSADEQREVAFHELVNYLRLTPYKFRRDRSKGVMFFACTSVLLRRYREAYDA